MTVNRHWLLAGCGLLSSGHYQSGLSSPRRRTQITPGAMGSTSQGYTQLVGFQEQGDLHPASSAIPELRDKDIPFSDPALRT